MWLTASRGRFARERFRARRKAWLKRVWWIFPIGAAIEVALFVALGALFQPDHMPFFWGLGVGVATTMVMIFADSPPHYIERWRQGAQGERSTARTLRPLTKNGWTLVNDIDTGHGNIDHILIGPPGVFLLESKDLRGIVSVERGTLSVRWHEDPHEGYENRHLAPRVRAASAQLAQRLPVSGVRRFWVQPVVVLWATFEQRSIESDGVAWVRGKDLANVLAARPVRLVSDEVAEIVTHLRRPERRSRDEAVRPVA